MYSSTQLAFAQPLGRCRRNIAWAMQVKSAFPQTPEALAEHPFGRIPSIRWGSHSSAALLIMQGTGGTWLRE